MNQTMTMIICEVADLINEIENEIILIARRPVRFLISRRKVLAAVPVVVIDRSYRPEVARVG